MTPSGRAGSRALGLALAVVAAAATISPVWGQQVPPQQPAAPAQQPAAPGPLLGGVSPRGAFARAVLVPGWGHVAIGSYSRAGFYVALESLTAYTFLRTRTRLSDARERVAFRESFVRGTLAAGGVTHPDSIQAGLEGDDVLLGLQDLVASRENQQEDLVAFGIFVLFLTGADAFVSAHLRDFPTPIEVSALPTASGGAELAVRVALPRRVSRRRAWRERVGIEPTDPGFSRAARF